MSTYNLYDKNGKIVTHHDLQDKGVWCKDGVRKEEVFVELFGKDLEIVINPEKTTNIYAPDLLEINTRILGDLKVQNTPFFKAEPLYGIDPRYAVVFNEKDKIRYEKDYPNINIYYWVDWEAVGFEMGTKKINIEPFAGIWKISIRDLSTLCTSKNLHTYQQRTNDNRGNAKGSYVLDLRNPLFEKIN